MEGLMQKVLVVHQGAVHFSAIDQMGHGFTHPQIVKGWSTNVHGKALEPNRVVVVNFLFDNPVFGKFFPFGSH